MKKQILNCAIALLCINTFFVNRTTASCGIPAGLTVGNITPTSAVIEWMPIAGAIRYNIQFHKDGTTIWENATSNSVTLTLTGLNPGIVYFWRVQAECQSGISSFSEMGKLLTQRPTIGAPAGTAANSVTASSAMLSWMATSGACNYYMLQWKPVTSNTWTTSNVLVNNSFSLAGLAPCTGYQFRVRIICSYGTSGYSGVTNFTTTGCAVPNNNTPTSGRIANHENESVLHIALYPNPVRDNLKIEYTSANTGIVTANIYNLIGNNLLSVKNMVDEGINTFNLNTSELPEGIYLCELENKGEVIRTKFLISK